MKSEAAIEYRDIPSCPEYVAGSDGSIWRCYDASLEATKLGTTDGYLTVTIGGRVRLVHHLVLEAFKGPRPSKRHVGRHLDDVRSNNHVTNLEWGTRRDNGIDAVRNGRIKSGRKGKVMSFRLPEDLISEIQSMAVQERRSLSNMIDVLLREALDLRRIKMFRGVKPSVPDLRGVRGSRGGRDCHDRAQTGGKVTDEN